MTNKVFHGKAVKENWQLKEPFVLSRGSRTHAEVVYLKIDDGYLVGHSECQPNSRYNENADDVVLQLEQCFPASLQELEQLAQTLSSYAARNALDCALWDYKLKNGLSQIPALKSKESVSGTATYFTLSVAPPEEMAASALRAYARGCRRLKLKFAGEGDDERLDAVRSVAPDASIIIDANEAWTEHMLEVFLPILEKAEVDLLEQPLPVGADEALKAINTPIILCADESCHTAEDVKELVSKYDAINIKLDKTGGLTPALKLLAAAEQAQMKVMVGCMLGTSLSIAPAFIPAAHAHYVDLDAPLLLKHDRADGFVVDRSFVFTGSEQSLWG
ncbi:MAG: dipeptide epimerase [Kordiimonas sp.]